MFLPHASFARISGNDLHWEMLALHQEEMWAMYG
jgi:hypothetical protein